MSVSSISHVSILIRDSLYYRRMRFHSYKCKQHASTVNFRCHTLQWIVSLSSVLQYLDILENLGFALLMICLPTSVSSFTRGCWHPSKEKQSSFHSEYDCALATPTTIWIRLSFYAAFLFSCGGPIYCWDVAWERCSTVDLLCFLARVSSIACTAKQFKLKFNFVPMHHRFHHISSKELLSSNIQSYSTRYMFKHIGCHPVHIPYCIPTIRSSRFSFNANAGS